MWRVEKKGVGHRTPNRICKLNKHPGAFTRRKQTNPKGGGDKGHSRNNFKA